MTTIYIAGPMTNLPQFNVPAFTEAAANLRAEGHIVINPAELDSPEMQAQALASPDGNLASLEKLTKETWGDVLARDVKVISDGAEAIAVLPGWHKSRGARLEVFVGLLTGKQFFAYRPLGKSGEWLLAMPKDLVQSVIRDNMP